MTQQSQNPQQQNYGPAPTDRPPQQNGYGQQPYPPNYQQPPVYYPPMQPVQPVKKGFPVWAIFLLAIPIVIVGGCLVISLIVSSLASTAIQSAATAVSSDYNTVSGNSTVGSAAQVTPIQRDLSVTPARSFTYAGLQISVKKGQISNQITTNPARYRADSAHLDLTLTFTNPTASSISISSGLLQITLGDGTVYKKPFDFGVQQQDTQDQTFTFTVPPTATWSKAQLSLSQVDKVPVTIPLDAPVPAAAYPVNLAGTGSVNLKSPMVDYTLKSAKLDVDAAGKRAPTGKRYLVLTITIASHEPNSAYIGDGNFRLMVDGTPLAPDSTSIPLETGRADTTTNSEIVFLIPDNAQTATLQLGEKSRETGNISINLAAK